MSKALTRQSVEEASIDDVKFPKNCLACRYSGMDPGDSGLVCMHSGSGPLGTYLKFDRVVKDQVMTIVHKPMGHCGPEFTKFEQHSDRHEDGSLKS